MVVSAVPSISSGPRQLTSWKEIAHYLGINIRTAQKWERERKLPVRRTSDGRNRINADSAELELWRQQLTRVTSREDLYYRWPLGRDLTVEVHFIGCTPKGKHFDLLRKYLELLKAAFP